MSGETSSLTYSPELRALVLTLHFYSPRAYQYVRAVFDICLRHPRTLCKWYQSIDGAAGFSKEALTALSMKVNENSQNGYILHIMQSSCGWDGYMKACGIGWKKMRGCVDLGVSSCQRCICFNACCNRWQMKLPIGYFLVDGLDSEQRSNLVLEAASLAHKKGTYW